MLSCRCVFCDEWLLSKAVCVCVCVSEAGDEGGSSTSSVSVALTQRCADEATTVDVKCTVLPRADDSTTATLTSGHVTAATNEHDHMVSSTIHSDGK